MNSIYLSNCKRMRATKTGNSGEYQVTRRKTEEPIGWIRFFDVKPLGCWMLDPFLMPLSCHELMAIADIIVSMKVDHDIELYGEEEDDDDVFYGIE